MKNTAKNREAIRDRLWIFPRRSHQRSHPFPIIYFDWRTWNRKTTVINGIVQLFAELNDLDLDPAKYTEEMFPILLAAPTGRAAKRMNETTGLPSGTIHRLLGLNGREKTPSVAAKELEGGLLIVDEMSMVDTWLANTLFKSIPTNMQVILLATKTNCLQ